MSRSLKTAILLLLLVLVPIRGLAAASIGVCALGQEETLTQSDPARGNDHDSFDSGRAHPNHGSADGDHCGNTSFAAPPAPVLPASPLLSERIVGAERFAACFFPDYLDPPPLAR